MNGLSGSSSRSPLPEGGGQSGDSGFLNDIPVFDTQEEDGEVWHYTGAPL